MQVKDNRPRSRRREVIQYRSPNMAIFETRPQPIAKPRSFLIAPAPPSGRHVTCSCPTPQPHAIVSHQDGTRSLTTTGAKRRCHHRLTTATVKRQVHAREPHWNTLTALSTGNDPQPHSSTTHSSSGVDQVP